MIGAKLITSGLEAAMDKYAEHLKTSVVRAGTQAAAQEFYDEAKVRVPVDTGRLKSAIYQVYSEGNSGDGKATYHISWNKSKAPHGHLIEFGTKHTPAHPFLAPAYEAKKGAAYQAACDKMKDML
jgi:HK97 gp10 family phage protein